jgi:hypothetical protein
VPADRLQEAVQPADVLAVAHAAAHLRAQDCQVALQQRAVHDGQAGSRRGLRGKVDGEPGNRPGPGPGRAGAEPGGQLPPGVSLGQFPQPGLGDAREADGGLGLVDAQVAEPPGITRVFGVPAGAEGKRLDPAARVADERAPSVPVFRRGAACPPLFRLL